LNCFSLFLFGQFQGQHQTCDADLNVMPSEHVSSLLALISDAQDFLLP